MSSDSEDEDLLFHTGNENDRRSSSPTLMYILTGLAAISGFLFGYDTGVVSGSMILVRKDFKLTNFWHELIVSGTIGAACLVSLTTGSLMDRMGRKVPILIASTAFAVGSFFMAFASGKELLLCGRLIVGIGVGLGSATVPVYISECSPPDKRGVLVTLNNMAITGGQLVAGIVCGIFSQSTNGWRYMLGIAAVPALIQLCGFLLMPESPRFLVKKERYSEAQRVLSSIRSPYHQVQDELEDIKVSCTSTAPLGFFDCLKSMMTSATARKSLLIGCLLQLIQQIAGINTVMYYAASVLTMAGASNTQAIWLSATTALFNFLFTLVGIYLVAKWTRRRLLFTSLFSVIVALLLISISFKVIDSSNSNTTIANMVSDSSSNTTIVNIFSDSSSNTTIANMVSDSSSNITIANMVSDSFINATVSPDHTLRAGTVLALISMCIYLAAFAPGMGPLPWTINSEMHPPWCRAQAVSLATATNWISNLLVSLTFLSLTEYLGRSATFLLYALGSLLGFLALFFSLPETKDVPLEQVEQLFQPEGSSSSHGTVAYSRIEPSP